MILPSKTYEHLAFKEWKDLHIIRFFISTLVFTLAFLFSFFLFSFSAQAQLTPAMDLIKTYYEEEETQALIVNGKYTHIPIIDYGTEKVTVHEYKTPKGEKGYQIIIYKNNFAYSEGYGADAEHRTYVKNIDLDTWNYMFSK